MDWSFVTDFFSESEAADLEAEFDLDPLYPPSQISPSKEASPKLPSLLANSKKRSASPHEVAQSSSSQPSELDDEKVNRYLSPRAKRVKLMLESSLKTLVHEGTKFPTTLLPPSTTQEDCRLNLDESTLIGRMGAGMVRVGLDEIQKSLRQKPLHKADVLEAIDSSIRTWPELYKGSVPDGVKKLISLLKTLKMRLEGKTLPSLFGEEVVTLADKKARPLLKDLNIVVTSVEREINLLDDEVPPLDKYMLELSTLESEQERQAAELERQAAAAREKAKEFRHKSRNVALSRECLLIAANVFRTQTDQLKKRTTEVTEFLNLFEKETKAEEPPEAALILGYSIEPPKST